jgi:hypothetical protein
VTTKDPNGKGLEERIDEALAAWPAPRRTEQAALEWDEAADRVEHLVQSGNAVQLRRGGDVDVLAAPLPQTPDEVQSSGPLGTGPSSPSSGRISVASVRQVSGAPPSSGEVRMSNTPSERGPGSGRERRSYQDLAKLASSPSLTPLPPKSAPKIEVAPASARGKDTTETDSGIVDLKLLAQIDPKAEERAKTTELASAALFDDDDVPSDRSPASKPHVVAAVEALLSTRPNVVPPLQARTAGAEAPHAKISAVAAVAQAAPEKRSPLWMGAGAAAILGIAAAAMLMVRAAHKEPAALATASPPMDAPTVAVAPATPTPVNPASPQPVPTVASGDTDTSKLPVALKGGKSMLARQGSSKVSRFAPPPAKEAPPPIDPKLVAKDISPTPSQSGNLSEALRQAAGTTPSGGQADTSAQTPDFAPGSVPQKPSQGAVTGALGAVLPSARACLGPDDPVSRATVVFESSGGVSGITVSGAAAGKPVEACIKAALGKAKVPPFAQATYTATATIRPN